MIGTACFRLRVRSSSQCLTALALSKSHYSSPHPYFIQVIGKPLVASPTVFQSRSRSHHHQAVIHGEPCAIVQVPRSCCHTSSCMEGGHELRCATIWHGLLPSHHPSILHQSALGKTLCNPASLQSPCKDKSGRKQVWIDRPLLALQELHLMHGLSLPHSNVASLGRFSMEASLPDGSWNAAWDARPARWLHGRDSAWLLFGVCNCFFAVSGMLPMSPSHVDVLRDQEGEVVNENMDHNIAPSVHQKESSVGYTITGIPSDGRCLFRAITYGACARSHEPTPDENLQQELADNLRNKVVDELISRRSESEWFIEEDFDTYVKRMREPYVWGGEPELLMASHVLKMPITVHLLDKSSGQLISVAEYGKEYGCEDPIRVLYHGFGHYDVLQLEAEGMNV